MTWSIPLNWITRFELAVLLAFTIGGAPAVAQSRPEDVVRAFFKAEDEGRWLDAARMLDLKRFEPYRRSAVEGMRSNDKAPLRTADDLMKLEPDMPRAVAEYQAKQMNESLRRFNYVEHEFARVTSVDSLAALSTEEAAARWLEAMGPDWKQTLAERESARLPAGACDAIPDSVRTEIRTSLRQLTARILGVTAGSDSVRYVVIGRELGIAGVSGSGEFEAPAMSPAVMTLRRMGQTWKISPTVDLAQSTGIGGFASISMTCHIDSLPNLKK